MKKSVNILNRKARFSYEILDTYTSGIVLTGTEIKSIRASKASIAESFCEFNKQGELFVINMTVQEYDMAIILIINQKQNANFYLIKKN